MATIFDRLAHLGTMADDVQSYSNSTDPDPQSPASQKCRLCLGGKNLKSLRSDYIVEGNRENYGDMITQCFDLKDSSWTRSISSGWLICEDCVARLRDANQLKHNVLAVIADVTDSDKSASTGDKLSTTGDKLSTTRDKLSTTGDKLSITEVLHSESNEVFGEWKDSLIIKDPTSEDYDLNIDSMIRDIIIENLETEKAVTKKDSKLKAYTGNSANIKVIKEIMVEIIMDQKLIAFESEEDVINLYSEYMDKGKFCRRAKRRVCGGKKTDKVCQQTSHFKKEPPLPPIIYVPNDPTYQKSQKKEQNTIVTSEKEKVKSQKKEQNTTVPSEKERRKNEPSINKPSLATPNTIEPDTKPSDDITGH